MIDLCLSVQIRGKKCSVSRRERKEMIAKVAKHLNENELSKTIIGKAIEVHQMPGPGLLESVYERSLAYELKQSGLDVERQKAFHVKYREINFEEGFRLDLLINNKVIVEIKSVEDLQKVHFAQLLTYLKLAHINLGLLINCNTKVLKTGIKRIVKGV